MNKRIGQQRVNVDGRAGECTEEKTINVYVLLYHAECPSGYNGPQCANPCIYPYYGEGCLSKCDCTEEQCDSVFGRKATSVASKYLRESYVQ